MAFGAFVGRRAAWLCPRPRYQHGEAADRAGGASLGRRRPRLVLDTGLSGLELPHKGPGRRRNKGLFHAATEKPQISTGRAARAGGAGGHPPGSPPAARGPPWSGASGEPQSGQADPSLLLRMPPGSPGHVNRLHSALCGFGGLPLPLPSSGRVCPLCRPLNNCHSSWSHRPSHLCSPCPACYPVPFSSPVPGRLLRKNKNQTSRVLGPLPFPSPHCGMQIGSHITQLWKLRRAVKVEGGPRLHSRGPARLRGKPRSLSTPPLAERVPLLLVFPRQVVPLLGQGGGTWAQGPWAPGHLQSPRPSSFRYAIDRDSDLDQIFDIDADTGAIVTGKGLDRETAGWHNITVLAMEAGEPGGGANMGGRGKDCVVRQSPERRGQVLGSRQRVRNWPKLVWGSGQQKRMHRSLNRDLGRIPSQRDRASLGSGFLPSAFIEHLLHTSLLPFFNGYTPGIGKF